MKILVTGGSGFIGTRLVAKLSKSHSVTSVARNHPQSFPVNTINASYLDEKVLSILRDFDAIIHLAWTTTPALNSSLEIERQQNIDPSIEFIEQVKKTGVRSFTFVSSVGAVNQGNPSSNYGKAKLEVEEYLKAIQEKSFSTNIVRVSNVIDQSQTLKKRQGLIPAILKAFNQDRTFYQYGDAVKDYILLNDVTSAFSFILEANNTNCENYHLGSGYSYSTSEIVEVLSKHYGKKLKIKRQPMAKTDTPKVLVNPIKIKKLGWTVSEPLGELVKSISSLT